ncbi:uncharacterized protein LOC141714463 [Apium graveolens]|uniref:uncharacterized protein LOC141714463 n=1 Tax=Apium graveolens TaxID=4045 RepID=UPI003D7B1C37
MESILLKPIYIPKKSIRRRPLEYRPFGRPKNDWPLGGSAMANALDSEPVSELESPKLNIAGLDEWGGGVRKEFKIKLADCRGKLRKFRSRRDMPGVQIYASVRKKNNCIRRIKDENGEWKEETEEIQGVITRYFSQLFKYVVSDEGEDAAANDRSSTYFTVQCSAFFMMEMCLHETGLLHGCTIARGAPAISHLLFADDCYFFFKVEEVEANVMKRISNRYENISGQMVNYAKSAVTFSSNTTKEKRNEVCKQLGVSEARTPGNYLRMPMAVGRRKRATFSFLVEKVGKKLQGWDKQAISKGGKVTLLKTAAQVILNFWMNMLLIPIQVCEDIEKRMKAFWWGNGTSNRGIKWMSWERMCTVKEDGGLGFKKLRNFNKSMLSKQAWRLVNNTNPLLTRIMQAKYFPESDFLNAKLGANPSYVWRSVFETQDIVQQGCRTRIGDGRSTRVWKIPWLSCPENGCLTTEMPEELKHIMVGSLLDESQQSWDEVLPTVVALVEKHVNVNVICSWCQMYMEDDMHVLFKCCFASEVWNAVGLRYLVITRVNDIVMSLLQRVFSTGSRDQVVMVGLVCWNLWNRRNSWVWSHANTSVFGVKVKSYNMLTDWTRARDEVSKKLGQAIHNNGRWCKSAAGWIKINTDVACLPGMNQVGVGCVVRDEYRQFLRARSNVIQGRFQPREAEAIELWEALSWIKNWRHNKCVFESDSKLLVDAVNDTGGAAYFHMIVDEFRDIIKHFKEVLVVFAYRSANMVAHLLARVAYC